MMLEEKVEAALKGKLGKRKRGKTNASWLLQMISTSP